MVLALATLSLLVPPSPGLVKLLNLVISFRIERGTWDTLHGSGFSLLNELNIITKENIVYERTVARNWCMSRVLRPNL